MFELSEWLLAGYILFLFVMSERSNAKRHKEILDRLDNL